MNKRTRTILITSIILATALSVALISAMTRSTPTPTAAPPEPTMMTAPPERSPTLEPTQQDASGDAEDTARGFVTALQSSTSADPLPNSWLQRALPFVTARYGENLKSSYSDRGGATWEEFQTQGLTKHAAEVKVTRFPEDPELFMVEYEAQTKKGIQIVTSEPAVKVLTLAREGGAWRVSAMTELGDQPLDGGPVAPSDLGPDLEAKLDSEDH